SICRTKARGHPASPMSNGRPASANSRAPRWLEYSPAELGSPSPSPVQPSFVEPSFVEPSHWPAAPKPVHRHPPGSDEAKQVEDGPPGRGSKPEAHQGGEQHPAAQPAAPVLLRRRRIAEAQAVGELRIVADHRELDLAELPLLPGGEHVTPHSGAYGLTDGQARNRAGEWLSP